MVQPNEKCDLEKKIEWDEISQKAGNAFSNSHERKYNPVCKPLGMISSIRRVDSLEGHVGWVDKRHKIGNKLRTSKAVNCAYT